MDGHLKLVTAPAKEPVSYADADAHLNADGEDEAYVTALIAVARRKVEEDTGLALITQEWKYAMDDFPCGDRFEIPKGPLQSVEAVSYFDEDDTEAEFDSGDYQVDTLPTYGVVALRSDASWPTVTLRPSSGVVVEFTAGYGDDGADVPEPLRQAILILVGALYEHREPQITGTIVTSLGYSYESLIAPYRVVRF